MRHSSTIRQLTETSREMNPLFCITCRDHVGTEELLSALRMEWRDIEGAGGVTGPGNQTQMTEYSLWAANGQGQSLQKSVSDGTIYTLTVFNWRTKPDQSSHSKDPGGSKGCYINLKSPIMHSEAICQKRRKLNKDSVIYIYIYIIYI